MFNTTLTNEYLQIADTFDFGIDTIEELVLNGVRAALLPQAEREMMEQEFQEEFSRLRIKHQV
jgi:adenosine deaminase